MLPILGWEAFLFRGFYRSIEGMILSCCELLSFIRQREADFANPLWAIRLAFIQIINEQIWKLSLKIAQLSLALRRETKMFSIVISWVRDYKIVLMDQFLTIPTKQSKESLRLTTEEDVLDIPDDDTAFFAGELIPI